MSSSSPPAMRHPGTAGVHHLVAAHVAQHPHSRAVHDPGAGTSLTYQELWDRAGSTAATLAELGVGHGDLVAVDLDRSADLVVALLGIARAGAAYLPLDGHAPPDRVAAVLADAAVRAVVVGAADARRSRPLDVAPATPVLTVPRTAARPGTPVPHAAVDGDAPFYVAYTSGSTGTPKGVVVPHRAVRRLVTGATYCTIGPDDRVGHAANPAFDATTFEIWGALTAGATLVVLPSVVELPLDRWVELIRAEGITTLFLTTSLFHMVAREAPAALGSLRTLVVGGEQLELSAVRRVLAEAPPGRLVNGYGPTETTVFATYFDCTEESLAGRDRVPIGYALQQTELHVLDARLRPVAPGSTGELCVGGPGVATGYLGQPERTAASFVPYPPEGPDRSLVYRTGDLVRRLPDGALELVGRADRQVKLRGFRIELEEIERAAMATGLTDAAFVEKTGEGPDARLVGAFLAPGGGAAGGGSAGGGAPGPGTPGDAAARLTSALSATLPSYMLPAQWLVLDTLPIGPTGKADRRAVQRLVESLPAGGAEGRAAASGADDDAVTDRIARVWSELLNAPSVGPADDFLTLGGNSILATQASFRISEAFGVEIGPTDVLLAASLAELADTVRAAAPAPR
ncbi:non-ribosomal peptide synthetase [Streptomyces sp. NPDC049837]|uniref:non-ribosomal peptide synthetase n=1 Tax=Streptomyces sp. NPDC049837 TaxID=3155277 RepID=UPI00344A2F5C